MRSAAAAVLVLLLALPAWAAPPRRATLKLESRAPLVVSGRSFGVRERVVLTAVTGDARRALAVRASKKGSFRVLFALPVGRCAELAVRALGAGGSRAVLQLEPACDGDAGAK